MRLATREIGLLLTGLAILAGINFTVWRFEQAISSGDVVLLRLAPVDPRSLMQGDYMQLNYEITQALPSLDLSELMLDLETPYQPEQKSGAETLVIQLDQHQVATWVADGKVDQLAPDQRLLQVKYHHDQWQVGPNAFFFEEGSAKQYEDARYGEFRLQADGKTLLVGLRDEAYRPIGLQRSRW